MIPFLKSIAKAYASRYKDLSEVCFIFPNKRSGTFFLKYLKEECVRGPRLSPEVVTITDFVAILSERVVASRLDRLFLLYESYRELKGLPVVDNGESLADDFDSFRTWGETVLSDFSEVDQYMVPHEEIFKNVKDYREITSNFLTEEQKNVMAEYFGHADYGNPSQFWKNFNDTATLSDLKEKFIRLWQILSPLYEAFSAKLEERCLTTTGASYRQAVETLREKGRDALPFKKVVAVGFNALSASEGALFAELRDSEGFPGFDTYADFIWDATGPILTAGVNSASKFVRSNIRRFPAPEWVFPYLKSSENKEMPRLRVVAAPSKSAQVKIAGNLLAEQRERLSASEITDARVAVVLPDEGLLLPMLYSLPQGMGNVNLTMGYSLRLTSVVSFVSLLRMINSRLRMAGEDAALYHKDVRLFLGHPFTHALVGGDVIGKITAYLDKHHFATVTLSDIRGFSPVAADIMQGVGADKSPSHTIGYIDGVLAKVEGALENDENMLINQRLDVDHITVYRNALRRLDDILSDYSVAMRPSTVFRLVDRLLAGEKVGFEGEPLTGLQVMGTLETRSVDFDYLTIVSMNERVMPRRSRSRSFIPDSLRRGYGMPPSNYAESIFAYYFFRMISRAKEVTMIYDARTGGGVGGSGASRYILQLQHLFAKGMIERQDWKFSLSGKEAVDPSVEKTPDVMALLAEYEEEGGRNFSASALSNYRECEVRFFYANVLGINTDPEPSEYIDAIMLGNILHNVMLNVYVPQKYHKKFLRTPILIGREGLQKVCDDTSFLWLLVTRAINKEHFRLKEEELSRPLTGGAKMVGRRIMEMARRVLRRDLKLTPFRILGCEIDETLRITLKSGKVVNFRFAIDRLDEISGLDGVKRRRIVDYKTGSLKQDAPDFDSVFNGDYRSEQLFQLMTYAWLLGRSSGGDGNDDVALEIYHVPGMVKNYKVQLPTIGEEMVETYATYSHAFSEGMDEMLEGIFSKPTFDATGDEARCEHCELRSLCRR